MVHRRTAASLHNALLKSAQCSSLNWMAIDTLAATREARFGALWALIIVFTVPVVRIWQRVLLVVCLPLSIFVLLNQRDGQLRIHVLDVGQSQAIVVERNGRAVNGYRGFLSQRVQCGRAGHRTFFAVPRVSPRACYYQPQRQRPQWRQSLFRKRYPGIKWFGATTEAMLGWADELLE